MKRFLFSLATVIFANLTFSQNLIIDGNFNNWNSAGYMLSDWYSSKCEYERAGTSSNYSVKLWVDNTFRRSNIYQNFNYKTLSSNGINTRFHKLKFRYNFVANAQALNIIIQTYTSSSSSFEPCNKNFPTNEVKKITINPDNTNTNKWKDYEIIFEADISNDNSEKRLLVFEAMSTVTSASYDRGIYIDNVSLEPLYNLETSDLKKIETRIYPNPVKKILSIESQNKIEKSEIFSLTGQLIKTFKGTEIDLSELRKGTYILKIYSDKENISQKIIKE